MLKVADARQRGPLWGPPGSSRDDASSFGVAKNGRAARVIDFSGCWTGEGVQGVQEGDAHGGRWVV